LIPAPAFSEIRAPFLNQRTAAISLVALQGNTYSIRLKKTSDGFITFSLKKTLARPLGRSGD
jgi:hypothetical protein